MTPRSSSSLKIGGRGLALRLAAAQAPAGAVAGRAEGLAHRALGARQHERVAPHVAGDEHRLADRRGTPPAPAGGPAGRRASRPCGGRRRGASAVELEVSNLAMLWQTS